MVGLSIFLALALKRVTALILSLAENELKYKELKNEALSRERGERERERERREYESDNVLTSKLGTWTGAVSECSAVQCTANAAGDRSWERERDGGQDTPFCCTLLLLLLHCHCYLLKRSS